RSRSSEDPSRASTRGASPTSSGATDETSSWSAEAPTRVSTERTSMRSLRRRHWAVRDRPPRRRKTSSSSMARPRSGWEKSFKFRYSYHLYRENLDVLALPVVHAGLRERVREELRLRDGPARGATDGDTVLPRVRVLDDLGILDRAEREIAQRLFPRVHDLVGAFGSGR